MRRMKKGEIEQEIFLTTLSRKRPDFVVLTLYRQPEKKQQVCTQRERTSEMRHRSLSPSFHLSSLESHVGSHRVFFTQRKRDESIHAKLGNTFLFLSLSLSTSNRHLLCLLLHLRLLSLTKTFFVRVPESSASCPLSLHISKTKQKTRRVDSFFSLCLSADSRDGDRG